MTFFQEPEASHISGVLLVDKPMGPTSHDIVDKLRRKSGIERIGHGGTLDPLASGLLPIFIGEATKMSGFIQAHDKSYEFDITLGVTTDTDDSEGKVLSRAPVQEALVKDRIREVLLGFVGERLQTPPMFSAVKQQGVPLYKLARKGISAERPSRPVTIHSLDLMSLDGPVVTLRVHCSKGTYVRVLAREIGESLGCGGHVSRLRRLTVGSFSIENSVPLDEIERSWTGEDLSRSLLGPEKIFSELPSVEVLPHAPFFIQKGSLIPGVWIFRKEGLFQAKDTIRIMEIGGRTLGLAQTLISEEQASRIPGGVPVAKMILVFRVRMASTQGKTNGRSWKGDRVLLNHENGKGDY